MCFVTHLAATVQPLQAVCPVVKQVAKMKPTWVGHTGWPEPYWCLERCRQGGLQPTRQELYPPGRGAAWISALAWGARGHRFKSGRPDLPVTAGSCRICIGCWPLRLSRRFFFLYCFVLRGNFGIDPGPPYVTGQHLLTVGGEMSSVRTMTTIGDNQARSGVSGGLRQVISCVRSYLPAGASNPGGTRN